MMQQFTRAELQAALARLLEVITAKMAEEKLRTANQPES